jgi:hypothetical protein
MAGCDVVRLEVPPHRASVRPAWASGALPTFGCGGVAQSRGRPGARWLGDVNVSRLTLNLLNGPEYSGRLERRHTTSWALQSARAGERIDEGDP